MASPFVEIEVGGCNGTAAWLDVLSRYGSVHNARDIAGPPADGDARVEVRARTATGDIVIRRTGERADGSIR